MLLRDVQEDCLTGSEETGSRSYVDLRLLWSEVPLDAGVRVGVEGDFYDALLYRRHRLHLIGVVPGHRRAAQPRRLAVEAVEWHCGVRQADHSHAGGGNVRQHRLILASPLRLLAPRPPAAAPSEEGRGSPPPQEEFSPGRGAAKRPRTSHQHWRGQRAAERQTQQQQHHT